MQLASIATNRSQKRSISTYKLAEIVPTPILFLQRDDNLTLCDRHVSILVYRWTPAAYLLSLYYSHDSHIKYNIITSSLLAIMKYIS